MYDPDHESFTAPTNLDIPVWRYMDLPKLVSMLSSGALWFSRADLLGDPHEGSRGRLNREERKRNYGENYQRIADQMTMIGQAALRSVYINCWHMAEIESVAMWRAYTTTGHGVAIRSTFGTLTAGVTHPWSVFAGEVRYADLDDEFIDEVNVFSPFLYKRRSFEYEREVRLVTLDQTGREGFMAAADVPVGFALNADLGSIIESVYVAPNHPEWFREAVQAVVEKFIPGVPVNQSDLDRVPTY